MSTKTCVKNIKIRYCEVEYIVKNISIWNSIDVIIASPGGLYYPSEIRILSIVNGEISSYRIYKIFDENDFNKIMDEEISNIVYEPDPVDYEQFAILEEIEYCKFKTVMHKCPSENPEIIGNVRRLLKQILFKTNNYNA